MFRFFLFAFTTALLLLPASLTRAQQPDAADQVTALLTGKGYNVTEVGNFPDGNGNPRADTVYALMDASNDNLDSADVSQQVTWGFVALRKYYPRVDNLITTLASGKYLLFFSTTAVKLDQFMKMQINGDTFWNGVRGSVKIFDTNKKVYVGEKDFSSGGQIGKDQTNKDFTGTTSSLLPNYVSANAAGENLVLEPSTAYLPADGATSLVLIGTLRDKNYLPLAQRGISFESEIPGQSATTIGAPTTDANGSARASLTSKHTYDSVLFRATTLSLNSQVSLVVGPSVASTDARVNAVVSALTKQSYADVQADYETRTSPTGEKTNSAIVQLRMASNAFDRVVYSQMALGFGTLRTLFPDANRLVVGLVVRQSGSDVSIWWQTQTAYWDNYVAGKLSENDFWRYLEYLGAEDANGNALAPGDKNFIDQNFGAGNNTREAKIKRTLESTVTSETWGEQFRGQEFVIVAGGYADSFKLANVSGGASGFAIYQSPEFRTPVFVYNKDDSPDNLNSLRLGQGQYYFAVSAPIDSAPPSAARVTYMEHLPQ